MDFGRLVLLCRPDVSFSKTDENLPHLARAELTGAVVQLWGYLSGISALAQ